MINGITLTLMIGPGIPLPVPREVVEALTSVEIETSADKRSGFKLSFNLGKNSALQTIFLLAGGGGAAPPLRVLLYATLNGIAEPLADGVMTGFQTAAGAPGQPSTLNVFGTDLTHYMGMIPFDGLPYPAMPVEARVLLILAKYAVLGIIPIVIPRVVIDIDNPLDRIPRHQGNDLDYLMQLACEAGYVFYVEPGPVPGTSTAYWGPQIKVGVPQPALTMDSDAETNVGNLTFHFNAKGQTQPIVWIQNSLTKVPIPVPIPNVSLLNPPLGLVPPLPGKFVSLNDTAKRSIPQAILFGLVEANRDADCLTAEGSLDVLRYGHILKARRLVGVRGAGMAYDGLYYVNRVTHYLKRGEYKQSFALSRNGLVSTTPRVPV